MRLTYLTKETLDVTLCQEKQSFLILEHHPEIADALKQTIHHKSSSPSLLILLKKKKKKKK